MIADLHANFESALSPSLTLKYLTHTFWLHICPTSHWSKVLQSSPSLKRFAQIELPLEVLQ